MRYYKYLGEVQYTSHKKVKKEERIVIQFKLIPTPKKHIRL